MSPSNYISGFCSTGLHEGIQPKNVNGRALPTCTMPSKDCSCACHKTLDEMFKLSEMDRITVDRSGYVPDRGDFVMPTPQELVEVKLERTPVPVIRTESPDPARVPASIVRTFAPTPTGRSGRGELEQQVDAVCKVWVIEQDVSICTPKYISEQIAETFGIIEPSVGAIGAVFDRWVTLGYADCQRKPVRFVAYTDAGRELGLDGCKQQAKQRSKLSAR